MCLQTGLNTCFNTCFTPRVLICASSHITCLNTSLYACLNTCLTSQYVFHISIRVSIRVSHHNTCLMSQYVSQDAQRRLTGGVSLHMLLPPHCVHLLLSRWSSRDLTCAFHVHVLTCHNTCLKTQYVTCETMHTSADRRNGSRRRDPTYTCEACLCANAFVCLRFSPPVLS